MKSSKRKDQVFSVSMRSEELEKVQNFLDWVKKETGFEISRNEFMRKCALAHIKSVKEGLVYEEAFKNIV